MSLTSKKPCYTQGLTSLAGFALVLSGEIKCHLQTPLNVPARRVRGVQFSPYHSEIDSRAVRACKGRTRGTDRRARSPIASTAKAGLMARERQGEPMDIAPVSIAKHPLRDKNGLFFLTSRKTNPCPLYGGEVCPADFSSLQAGKTNTKLKHTQGSERSERPSARSQNSLHPVYNMSDLKITI